jgi:hypothetical protein
MAVKIKRGSDKRFVVKLRYKNGDPRDLTGVDDITIKLPKKDGTKLTIDTTEIPAVKSSAVYLGVTYTAVTGGKLGNSIILPFDGVKTITQVITDWNTANPSNTVSSNAATPNVTVPTTANLKLANGSDAYQKVSVMSPVVLGKILLKLPNVDTASLRLANEQSIEVAIVDGDDPVDDSIGLVIPNAIDVID